MNTPLSPADQAAPRAAIAQSSVAKAAGHQGDQITGHAELNLGRDAARALGPTAGQGAVVMAGSTRAVQADRPALEALARAVLGR